MVKFNHICRMENFPIFADSMPGTFKKSIVDLLTEPESQGTKPGGLLIAGKTRWYEIIVFARSFGSGWEWLNVYRLHVESLGF